MLGILVWQEGGEAVAVLIALGAFAMGSLAYWLVRRKRAGKPTLLDPDLFKAQAFRFGITGQLLQQIALGGLMIALPIFLQMVLEYNAMQAGLSLAPLSLSMFAIALLAGKRAGAAGRAASSAPGSRSWRVGVLALLPIVPRARLRAGRSSIPLMVAGSGLGLLVSQLNNYTLVADLRGARQRGGRRELGRRVVRALVRPGVRGRDHARDAVVLLHQQGGGERGALARGSSRRSPTRSTTTPRS